MVWNGIACSCIKIVIYIFIGKGGSWKVIVFTNVSLSSLVDFKLWNKRVSSWCCIHLRRINVANSSPKSMGKLCKGELLFSEETLILCVLTLNDVFAFHLIVILLSISSCIFIIAWTWIFWNIQQKISLTKICSVACLLNGGVVCVSSFFPRIACSCLPANTRV